MSKGMLSPSGAMGVPLSWRNLATAALAMAVPSGKLSENKVREDAEEKAYELTRKTASGKEKKLT